MAAHTVAAVSAPRDQVANKRITNGAKVSLQGLFERKKLQWNGKLPKTSTLDKDEDYLAVAREHDLDRTQVSRQFVNWKLGLGISDGSSSRISDERLRQSIRRRVGDRVKLVIRALRKFQESTFARRRDGVWQ